MRSIAYATEQRSVWLKTAAPAPACSAIDRDIRTEILVVGGGYAGLNAALRLRETGRDCVVLEADEIGFGGSGRNGGQVIPGLKYDPQDLLRMFGETRGARLARFAGDAAGRTFQSIERYRMACDARPGGWLQPAVDEQTLRTISARGRAWRDFADIEVRFLDRGETRKATGTDHYLGGWIDPRGGQLQPLSYARELARVAIDQGARIFVRSPVAKLERVSGNWQAEANGRKVTAQAVLVCTNGYTARLVPGLDRAAIPASSIICATAPLPPALRSRILPLGLPVSDARRLLTYMRYDAEGRFLIGARGSFGLHEPENYFRRLRARAVEIFPELADARWESAWGGRFALTVDHLPHVHMPGNGLMAVIGCNGRGVAMMSQLGSMLADLATGTLTKDEAPVPVTPLRPVPLHALRRVGLEAFTLWYRLLDALPRV